MADDIGVSEGEVGGVVASEAGSRDTDFMVAGVLSNLFDDFLSEHFIVPDMVLYFLGRMDVSVVPAEFVNAVHAKELYFSVVEEPLDRVNEFEIFAFIIASHGGGENQKGLSGMTINEHFHIAA